jgi:hypothetical protein
VHAPLKSLQSQSTERAQSAAKTSRILHPRSVKTKAVKRDGLFELASIAEK